MSYFSNERAAANEMFLGADGFGADGFGADADADGFGADADADGFGADADADGFGADAEFSGQELNAIGRRRKNQHAQRKPDSQPYIIVVTCGTNNLQNVEILNASATQYNNNAQVGVTLTSGIPSISYQQLLGAIAGPHAFEVGQLRLVATNTVASTAQIQVLEVVTISSKELDGNQAVRPFIPVLDSYQYSQTQTDIWYNFYVNGLTSITIANLYANTVLKVMLYPSRKLNTFKALKTNQGGAIQLGNPNTNRALRR